jgi:hypothetical protein
MGARERLYCVRHSLYKEDVLKAEGGGYVVIADKEMKTISNLEYEYNIWAKTPKQALEKAWDMGGTLTPGLYSITVNPEHKDTRIKQ